MNQTQQRESIVDELLRERREEAQRDTEAHPGLAMTTEEFRARLKMRGEATLQRQASRRAAKQQEGQSEAQRRRAA